MNETSQGYIYIYIYMRVFVLLRREKHLVRACATYSSLSSLFFSGAVCEESRWICLHVCKRRWPTSWISWYIGYMYSLVEMRCLDFVTGYIILFKFLLEGIRGCGGAYGFVGRVVCEFESTLQKIDIYKFLFLKWWSRWSWWSLMYTLFEWFLIVFFIKFSYVFINS